MITLNTLGVLTIFYSTICFSTPNIIFLVADDLPYTTAWNSLGLAPEGSSLYNYDVEYLNIDTPQISKVMNDSVIIPRTYSGGPKCAPSRYSLLTGRQPVRSLYAQAETIDSTKYDETEGTYVTVPYCKIYDTDDDYYNLAAVLNRELGYKTGMFGKWHLTPDDDPYDSCGILDSMVDADVYEKCRSRVQDVGFDDVNAFYQGNLMESTEFSHNPEWKVAEAKKFMTEAQEESKPFFFTLSFTLAHSLTSSYTALSDSDGMLYTPKGELTGEDKPGMASGMRRRSEILSDVDDVIQELGITDSTDKDLVASTIWIDEAIGAITSYLDDNGLKDDTMLVIVNDHGYEAKSTLYEHGTRQLQVVRYPALWPSTVTPYISSDDFVTSNVDLAAVVYDIVGLDVSTFESIYPIDGISWKDDLTERIYDDTLTSSSCCTIRVSDIFNSHAMMISGGYTYIYRAGSTVADCDYYPYINDEEQLYNLNDDPNQQNNIIDDTAYSLLKSHFEAKMDEYIENTAYPEGVVCKTPLTDDSEITFLSNLFVKLIPLMAVVLYILQSSFIGC